MSGRISLEDCRAAIWQALQCWCPAPHEALEGEIEAERRLNMFHERLLEQLKRAGVGDQRSEVGGRRAAIGRVDWSGCAGCVFANLEMGGCSVDEQELMDNLVVSLDVGSISCGCFKALETAAPLVVEVSVSGGVAHVDKCPAGVEVVITDFDNEVAP